MKKAKKHTQKYQPHALAPGNGTRKELDNPKVKGIIEAISKGGSDKYGVKNPQEAKGKINILSSPICH